MLQREAQDEQTAAGIGCLVILFAAAGARLLLPRPTRWRCPMRRMPPIHRKSGSRSEASRVRSFIGCPLPRCPLRQGTLNRFRVKEQPPTHLTAGNAARLSLSTKPAHRQPEPSEAFAQIPQCA